MNCHVKTNLFGNGVAGNFEKMSDVDNYLPTPKSPVEGDEPITLTNDQIQHVLLSFSFSNVAHYTDTIREKHRRV